MKDTLRLHFRTWTQEDAEELYRYAKDPDVGPSAGWPPHTSVENSRQIIRDVLSAKGTYAVVLKQTGLPIGSIGILRNANIATKEREVEIGYWLGKPYWGQGLIPEAVAECLRYCFEELDCAKVWCAYYEGNEKSRRVQEKCGFLLHHIERDVQVPLLGEIRTDYVQVLTRQQWEQKVQKK